MNAWAVPSLGGSTPPRLTVFHQSAIVRGMYTNTTASTPKPLMHQILVLGDEEAPHYYRLERIPNTDRYLLCEVSVTLDNREIVAGATYTLDNSSVLSVSSLYKLLAYDENLAHLTIQAAMDMGHLERTWLAFEGEGSERERFAEYSLNGSAAYAFVSDAVIAVNKVAHKVDDNWEDNTTVKDFLSRHNL